MSLLDEIDGEDSGCIGESEFVFHIGNESGHLIDISANFLLNLFVELLYVLCVVRTTFEALRNAGIGSVGGGERLGNMGRLGMEEAGREGEQGGRRGGKAEKVTARMEHKTSEGTGELTERMMAQKKTIG